MPASLYLFYVFALLKNDYYKVKKTTIHWYHILAIDLMLPNSFVTFSHNLFIPFRFVAVEYYIRQALYTSQLYSDLGTSTPL